MTTVPETYEGVRGLIQWFGKDLGCSGWLEPDGSGLLTVGGHSGITTMEDIREIDAFICALGRVLGWRMPRGPVGSPLRLRLVQGRVRVTYLALSAECGFPVSDSLAMSEAKHLFGWLCRYFAWEDVP